MRIKDESEWGLFLSEIAADPDPRAEPFRDFLIAWAEAAEQTSRDYQMRSVEALRQSLRSTEALLGRWTVGYLGMMLVVLGTHWLLAGDPDAFFNSLTPLEQNLFADVADAKLSTLAHAAGGMGDNKE